MTANEFRRMALSFPDAIEAAHMGHPDFAMVSLTPEQQEPSCARR